MSKMISSCISNRPEAATYSEGLGVSKDRCGESGLSDGESLRGDVRNADGHSLDCLWVGDWVGHGGRSQKREDGKELHDVFVLIIVDFSGPVELRIPDERLQRGALNSYTSDEVV